MKTGTRGSWYMTNTKRKAKTDRNREIVALRNAGASWVALSQKFNISVCRVRQIYDVWEGRNE